MKINKNLKVGLAFVVAIGIFVWGFNFLKGTDLFVKKNIYYAVYNQIGGLVKSNTVSINGLKIGQVEDIYFAPGNSGLIIVKLLMTNEFPIPSNSIARIYSADLMGSKAIDIVIGTSIKYAKPGDTLSSSIEASLKEEVNQQVAPLKKKAENMLSSIDSVLVSLRSVFSGKTKDNLASSFESIRNALNNIERTSFVIDTLVHDQKGRISAIVANVESISGNLKANNLKINKSIQNFSAISDSLAAYNFSQTFRKIDHSLNKLASIMSRIEKGEGTVGQLVSNDSLFQNLNNASAELDALIKDIRKNPKKYVKISVF
ncbi:MAG: MlaD family protein [Bacteroidales bacterium]|nr:MlaD family protein [Bacteroidales bacterium]